MKREFGFCRPLVVLLALAAAPARAADAAPKAVAQTQQTVPGDEIFGFTSPSDIGQPGDTGFASENDGRLGKRDGRYSALNQKFEFSRAIAGNWWIAGSFFLAHNHSVNVTGVADIGRSNFDGLSFEIAHKIIERSAGNPFAVTLSVEPRWSRVDGVSGLGANAYGATFKLFTDAAVIPGKLYWGGNIQFTAQNAQDPNSPGDHIPGSTLLLSSALAWQASSNLFLGAEARYFTTFDSAFGAHPNGHALYIGPTLMWKITDKIGLNVTYQPQILGHSAANNNLRLDLDNFERAQFRLKLAAQF